ncbi:MAG: nitrile hydratase subunit beta [Paracoccaceae bacterium]|nr:nitrile hydratase subunit beta [Paracoccaceae bacterium]
MALPSSGYGEGLNVERKGIQRYHDVGGDQAGDIPMVELLWMHREKQVEAIRTLLGDCTGRIVSPDEVQRGFESFGLKKYNSLSFYRRRLEAMTYTLTEKGIVSGRDFDGATHARWSDPDNGQ